MEEVQGLAMCTISMHNLLHIHEDIINFSASDNFWCAVFERAVKEYVKKSHNGKNIEATFAHVESIREYLKSVEEKEHLSLGKHDVPLVSSKILTTYRCSVTPFFLYKNRLLYLFPSFSEKLKKTITL